MNALSFKRFCPKFLRLSLSPIFRFEHTKKSRHHLYSDHDSDIYLTTEFFQNCEELVACLSRGDFVDFTTQLEGLVSIYQLNADKKVKCKAFSALQSLEADLGVLAQLQTFIKEPFNLVHKSPVG